MKEFFQDTIVRWYKNELNNKNQSNKIIIELLNIINNYKNLNIFFNIIQLIIEYKYNNIIYIDTYFNIKVLCKLKNSIKYCKLYNILNNDFIGYIKYFIQDNNNSFNIYSIQLFKHIL